MLSANNSEGAFRKILFVLYSGMEFQSVYPNDIESVNNGQIDECYEKSTLKFKK